MIYSMEELLPVVAMLTDKFTSKESTSITYERARQLMGAVTYCINHTGTKNQLMPAQKLSPMEAYKIGYENVLRKVEKARQCYNGFANQFQYYGCENYRDTVLKGIPQFFLHYDAKFCPQNTILTLDYPVLTPLGNACGVDAIDKYVACISLEQKFFGSMDQETVIRMLMAYDSGYQKQFYNICFALLKQMAWACLCQPAITEQSLLEWFSKLIEERYEGNRELLAYFSGKSKDFYYEVKNKIV